MPKIIFLSFFSLIFANSFSQEETDFQVIFSNESSIQFEDFLLALSLNTPNPQISIKYTIDGKTPSDLSAEYSSEIEINNPVSNSGSTYGVIVRAAGFLDEERVTNIKSCSYVFYKESTLTYQLPVISLITDGSNLYNADTGIYVKGVTYTGSQWSGNYFQTGKEWERDIHLTYFDENGIKQLEQDAGVRIHGGLQRNASQKSLRFYARKEYGDKDFDYQLLPQKEKDSYKRFILRTPQGDWNKTVIKDAVGAELVRGLNIEMQDYRPVITLLNGENFGIYWIRDYFGTKHFEDKYDISEESLDIITGSRGIHISTGSNENYQDILSFVRDNDLSIQENYDFVASQIDVYDMINYYASQIYMNNYDWPSGNLKAWKSTEKDNKWRWVMYDLDAAFNGRGGFNYNTLNQATTDSDGWPNPPGSGLLLGSLLENPTFRDEFITRSAYIAHYHFASDRVIDIIERIKSIVEPEMDFQYDRWNDPSGSGSFNSAINSHLVAFATARGPYVQSHYTSKFGLSGMADLTLIANAQTGSVVLNDLPIPHDNNSANYYMDATIRLKAIPETGYIFDHWEGNVSLTNQAEIEIVLDKSETITAVFRQDETEYELSINEVKSCSYDDGSDWVELLLATQDDIELEDWFLSDDITELNKWKLSDFSTTFSQDEETRFLVVESYEEGTELKFSAGETVYLSKSIDNNTVITDELTIPFLPCKLTTGIANNNTQSVLNPTKGSVNITYESSFDLVNDLFINEVLASNKNSIKDESNSYEDWIELYNGSSDELNINGLYITDKKDKPYNHEIQLSDGILVSNDHLVLWADDDEDDGEDHLNFKLSKDGDCVYLNQFTQGQLVQLDSLCFTQQISDVSYGRKEDGSTELVFFNAPTPNEENGVVTDLNAPILDASSFNEILTFQCSGRTVNTPRANDDIDGIVLGTTTIVFPVTETTEITWTFTDQAGNTSTATQNIIIEDNTAPVSEATTFDEELVFECSGGKPNAPRANDNCDGIIIGTTTTQFPVSETTEVTWTFTDNAGNSSTASQNIIIRTPSIEAPIESITTTGTPSETTFYTSEIENASYQWYSCDTDLIIEGATNYEFMPSTSGRYKVTISKSCVTETSNCSDEIVMSNLIISPEISSFEVYPNPSSDIITIELLGVEIIGIYDITGILVLTSSTTQVNIQHLKAGIYIIKKGEQTSRFVKE